MLPESGRSRKDLIYHWTLTQGRGDAGVRTQQSILSHVLPSSQTSPEIVVILAHFLQVARCTGDRMVFARDLHCETLLSTD